MRFTIKSRKHGPQDFWANAKEGPYASSYVYLEDKGVGITGSQICEGGCFRGETLACDGTPEGLEAVARRWWRAFLRNNRELVARLPNRFDQADVTAWLNSLVVGWNEWTDVGQIVARETRVVHSAGFFGEDSQTQHWGLVNLCREYVDTSGYSDVRHPAGDQVWMRVHEEEGDRV